MAKPKERPEVFTITYYIEGHPGQPNFNREEDVKIVSIDDGMATIAMMDDPSATDFVNLNRLIPKSSPRIQLKDAIFQIKKGQVFYMGPGFNKIVLDRDGEFLWHHSREVVRASYITRYSHLFGVILWQEELGL